MSEPTSVMHCRVTCSSSARKQLLITHRKGWYMWASISETKGSSMPLIISTSAASILPTRCTTHSTPTVISAQSGSLVRFTAKGWKSCSTMLFIVRSFPEYRQSTLQHNETEPTAIYQKLGHGCCHAGPALSFVTCLNQTT